MEGDVTWHMQPANPHTVVTDFSDNCLTKFLTCIMDGLFLYFADVPSFFNLLYQEINCRNKTDEIVIILGLFSLLPASLPWFHKHPQTQAQLNKTFCILNPLLSILFLLYSDNYIIFGITSPSSVCPSIRPSIRLSVHHTFSVPSHFFCPNAITQVQLMLLKLNFICG